MFLLKITAKEHHALTRILLPHPWRVIKTEHLLLVTDV